MAYSEELRMRIAVLLAYREDVVEKKMFGGIAFMVSGHMACGVLGERLVVRLGDAAAQKYVGRPHIRPMDFTGKVLKSFAMIDSDGIKTRAQLRKWVRMATEFAEHT
jgi:TfoX/Sxy family transcriptional regulator of competence genes